ncbi:MAG: 3-deoxy-manno-octulosonate cytidylyltransferase [Ignavibacteria bacterium]|nr:3-deoxy-manno-octulosonate cytidylyltransferase [Ignavibacteria bacterium]
MTRTGNIVGIIPARYASTRLPAKPLIQLCGKPMIQHVYERAKESRLLDKVIIATDHEKIAEAVKRFNGEVMLTPSGLRSGTDRIAYAAKTLTDTAIVANIQGDEPLIAPQMIDEAVQMLIEDEAVHVGTLVKEIISSEELRNPNIVKVVRDTDGNGIYFSRSPIPYLRDGVNIDQWHTQHLYYKHIGLYVFRRDFLLKFASWQESTIEKIERLEQLRIIEHGYKIKTSVTTYDSVPVDAPEDVEKIGRLMQQHKPIDIP